MHKGGKCTACLRKSAQLWWVPRQAWIQDWSCTRLLCMLTSSIPRKLCTHKGGKCIVCLGKSAQLR